MIAIADWFTLYFNSKYRQISQICVNCFAICGHFVFSQFFHDFRMTLFIALGVLGAWISCFLAGGASPDGIFLSMMFAYTWMWPEQGVLLFGIIPFKMKYLGWYELLVWAVQFLTGTLTTKISLVLGLLGFLVFFGREVFDWCRDTLTGYKRRRDWQNRNR